MTDHTKLKIKETQTFGPIREVMIVGHFPMSRARLRKYNAGLTSGPFRRIDEVLGAWLDVDTKRFPKFADFRADFIKRHTTTRALLSAVSGANGGIVEDCYHHRTNLRPCAHYSAKSGGVGLHLEDHQAVLVRRRHETGRMVVAYAGQLPRS